MKYKERKDEEKHRQEILLALPSFINQLLLLLNSGMVLQEAMTAIAMNYEKTGCSHMNTFAREYKGVYDEAQKTGKSILIIFNDYCKNSHIKEMSRLSGILIDSDKRGTELWDKLSEEGKSLWEQRRRMALEKIKISESKMSFPLALLLIALILIAAAPAMMQMYI